MLSNRVGIVAGLYQKSQFPSVLTLISQLTQLLLGPGCDGLIL